MRRNDAVASAFDDFFLRMQRLPALENGYPRAWGATESVKGHFQYSTNVLVSQVQVFWGERPGFQEMQDCVFCQIIAGESPASVFYEDDVVLGFMTIGPVTTGHAMIVPKKHTAYLADLDEETGRHLWTVTQRTAAAIHESGVRCEGINLFLADGQAAFQEIFHIHIHVFPRYEGDSFKLIADWDVKPSREELDQVAQQIKLAYGRLWGSSSQVV